MEIPHIFTSYEGLEEQLRTKIVSGERLSKGTWDIEENRAIALKWLVEVRCKGDSDRLTQEIFRDNHLGSLLKGYDNNLQRAKEEYLAIKIKEERKKLIEVLMKIARGVPPETRKEVGIKV